MKTTIHLITTALAAAAAFALTACSDDKDSSPESDATPDSASTTDAAPDSRITSVFIETEPEGALAVVEARSVVAGSPITVTGRIAGTMKPFSEEYASLVIIDSSIDTCERIPGDTCETPWDACCEEPGKLAASRLTIQIVGDDGRPIEQSLKAVLGLTELDTITVKGTITDDSTDQNMIINASRIHRHKTAE